MPFIKRIICLAISKKNNGYCIAGIELFDNWHVGRWIRPVYEDPKVGITIQDCQLNGNLPRVLDIVDIQFLRRAPYAHQTENHIIDTQVAWGYRGQVTWGTVANIKDNPRSIWIERGATSLDYVAEDKIDEFSNSLTLIEPGNLLITVQPGWNGSRNVRARFDYSGRSYDLKITDLLVVNSFLARGIGHYPVTGAYLCISLAGESFRGGYYKLVAAVITRTPL